MSGVPARRATFVQRLERRAAGRPLVLCAGIDPAPEAVALLEGGPLPTAGASRATRAGAIERFCGLVVESVRDDAIAVKFQLAWFELAGPAGMRALERAAAYARAADLLVVLDAKRGDIPHSAAAYARAWLGDEAESGTCGDALTVHGAVGADSIAAMAEVAEARRACILVLVHTSNPGAAELQGAVLEATGSPWWHLLARRVAEAGPAVGAVVGATRPDVLREARELLPGSTLLVPGIGAQGASVDDLCGAVTDAAPPTLVAASRSLLPTEQLGTQAFRNHVHVAATALADGLLAGSAAQRA